MCSRACARYSRRKPPTSPRCNRIRGRPGWSCRPPATQRPNRRERGKKRPKKTALWTGPIRSTVAGPEMSRSPVVKRKGLRTAEGPARWKHFPPSPRAPTQCVGGDARRATPRGWHERRPRGAGSKACSILLLPEAQRRVPAFSCLRGIQAPTRRRLPCAPNRFQKPWRSNAEGD